MDVVRSKPIERIDLGMDLGISVDKMECVNLLCLNIEYSQVDADIQLFFFTLLFLFVFLKNRDDLSNSLNKLKVLMEHYCKTLNSQWFSHEELQHLQHQIGILRSALAKSDHPLHTLQSR